MAKKIVDRRINKRKMSCARGRCRRRRW